MILGKNSLYTTITRPPRTGKRRARRYVRKALSFALQSGYLEQADREGNLLRVSPSLIGGAGPRGKPVAAVVTDARGKRGGKRRGRVQKRGSTKRRAGGARRRKKSKGRRRAEEPDQARRSGSPDGPGDVQVPRRGSSGRLAEKWVCFWGFRGMLGRGSWSIERSKLSLWKLSWDRVVLSCNINYELRRKVCRRKLWC